MRAYAAYRTPIAVSERYFKHVMPGEASFHDFLTERRREKHGPILVMDVMGQGCFIAEGYPVDYELALTLVDPRDDEEIARDVKAPAKSFSE
jgi:hypothetical protein